MKKDEHGMLKIVQMKISDVHPYEKNPRMNDNAVEPVAKSIAEFGFRSPIVVDRDHVIICGHTRLKAAQRLGLETVPVHVAADLTMEQTKAMRLVDNRTGELAKWDLELLGLEMQDLEQMNFKMDDYGFSDLELSQILGENDPVKQGKADPDAVPETPSNPISKRGAVYRLGEHRVMCGDSTDKNDLIRLMDGRLVDLWLTDPPYNVDYSDSLGQTIENDNMDDASFRAFLNDSFTRAVEVMKPGASYYIFHADTEGYNFRGACRDVGLKVRECLIWVKNALVLGRCDYHFRHEPCLYGWKEGAAHNWYSDRCQTTVLEFNKPSKNIGHPTAKPVEMLVYLIKNSSQRGETVLDTFGGSGSTLIACEQTGRVCQMMELDPKYCDVIRRRWAEFAHGEGCDWEKLTPTEE